MQEVRDGNKKIKSETVWKIRWRRKQGIEENKRCEKTTEKGAGDGIRERKAREKAVSTLVRIRATQRTCTSLCIRPSKPESIDTVEHSGLVSHCYMTY